MERSQEMIGARQRLGEAWIRAIVEKDFGRITALCQPDAQGRLMTPSRVHTPENAAELSQKVEGWFGEAERIKTEEARVAMVGEKLGIFYRLHVVEGGVQMTIEQQVYCTLRDGLISQVSLLCSGFQPVQQAEGTPGETGQAPSAAQSLPADAVLEIQSAGGEGAGGEGAGGGGSTCAILTPAIRQKLRAMTAGQVLEVHVDDPTAKDDIEAWCRMSGNQLVKMEQGVGKELRFFVRKKG